MAMRFCWRRCIMGVPRAPLSGSPLSPPPGKMFLVWLSDFVGINCVGCFYSGPKGWWCYLWGLHGVYKV